MAKGFSLVELAVVICIACVVMALTLPRAAQFMDWIATDHAVRQLSTALAVARHGAVMQSTRSRLTISGDSLRIDRLIGRSWVPWWRQAGPRSLGVALVVSNPVVQFGPNGIGWGASNTTVVLRRGSQVETITVSRVGRVKHW